MPEEVAILYVQSVEQTQKLAHPIGIENLYSYSLLL